ncbi:hypothetical protein PR202_ga03910 [Eleusine coracana subsp. coracana]|uniref:Uncharacterized protein n=1 Tax=Eleusine coracana subsp. coracana TaxID=191504 RepID=A0AAV5BNY1_ELECO|nr:hypothetical protein PR202_ga03910 [Eleusine coracana subsp. coracana]
MAKVHPYSVDLAAAAHRSRSGSPTTEHEEEEADGVAQVAAVQLRRVHRLRRQRRLRLPRRLLPRPPSRCSPSAASASSSAACQSTGSSTMTKAPAKGRSFPSAVTSASAPPARRRWRASRRWDRPPSPARRRLLLRTWWKGRRRRACLVRDAGNGDVVAEVRRRKEALSVGDDVFRLVVADPRRMLAMALVIALDEMFCFPSSGSARSLLRRTWSA